MANTSIKKAVKEALTDKRLEDLAAQMTSLSTQLSAGFASIHTRQDTTNGKVLKNTADIEKITNKATYDKFLWLTITTLVGVVVYFLTKGHAI